MNTIFNQSMFQTLLPNEAIPFIQAHPDCLILDVRTPEEFNEGHLPQATNIPVDTIPTRLTEIPEDKTLVIYCLHGSRSKLAANFLSARNYPNVYHIQGGYETLRTFL